MGISTSRVGQLGHGKGFDNTNPELAIGICVHHGWPTKWARHFQYIWGHQKRWLQVGRFTDTTAREAGSSVPQGDPLAPIAFILLLLEAAETFARLQAASVQALFVDDRNAVTTFPQQAVQAMRHWESWCQRRGLHENIAKVKFVTRNPADEQVLRGLGVSEDAIVQQARVLGIDFGQSEHLQPVTALKRWTHAEKILSRIGLLLVAIRDKMDLVRTRVMPLATWGRWLSNVSKMTASGWVRIKRVVKGHCSGSRPLWELLQGH